jgi:UDP-glucose 4-epimerase
MAFGGPRPAIKSEDKDNLIQAVLSWIFSSGARIRPTMSVLHIFRLGKIRVFRNHFPWMDPKKNSMTYLPISCQSDNHYPEKNASDLSIRKIAVNETAAETESEVLPARIVHEFIEKAEHHVIMDHCGCRMSGECAHFTADIGCLFMGETALKLPRGVSHRATKEEAHRHVDQALEAGLVPVVGKIRVDNFIFLTPDKQRLLSVCFCCHCCCMMGAFKHLPGDHLDQVMTRLEGVVIEVTDACTGCGTCVETCIFDAIDIQNRRAVHNDRCRACGRCVTYCPENAVKISIENQDTYVQAAMERIESYVRITG